MYKKVLPWFLALILSTQCAFLIASEEVVVASILDSEPPQSPEVVAIPVEPPKTVVPQLPFTAFTGKILKSKVRLRLEPNLNSSVLRELNVNDLMLVVGETEDFYAVEPPADVKAYIYRTYVLDGIIEGNHVNVRLEPELSSPIIAQLNSGDPVKGTISQSDKKWMEIVPPSSTRFYVAKEYVEKVGNASLITNQKRRWEEASTLFATAKMTSQVELQKPFDEINLEGCMQKLNKVVSQYADFPAEATQAKELLASLQTAYLNKKVNYIEANTATKVASTPAPAAPVVVEAISQPAVATVVKSTLWLPVEHALHEAWAAQNNNGNIEEFYTAQEENGIALRGIVEPYNRAIKNKPGDFMLINPNTRQPIAFIYSTRINLHDKVGEEISVKVAPRNNQHFAYPAYYVLTVN